MKPIEFTGQNIVIAKNQPPYQPLPSHRSTETQGVVTSCWSLTWRERLSVMWNGVVWVQLMTYGHPIMPSKLLAAKPVLTL